MFVQQWTKVLPEHHFFSQLFRLHVIYDQTWMNEEVIINMFVLTDLEC